MRFSARFFYRKFIVLCSSLLFLTICFSSCVEPQVDVYVAGVDGDEVFYMKNETKYLLPENTSSMPKLYVSNNNVYVVGEANNKACYWLNETKVVLSEETSQAFDIVVSGGNVYVVGEADNKACYWLNGTKLNVSDEELSSGWSIFVVNNDVYVAGRTHADGACYWIKRENNIEKHILAPTEYINTSVAKSIFVADNTIYVSGELRQTQRYCYWENTDMKILDNALNVGNIIKSGNNLYVAGTIFAVTPISIGFVPSYWKNGSLHTLPTGSIYISGGASSIYTIGDDVYVAGTVGYSADTHGKACFWKNNERVVLTDGTKEAYAYSIFVVPRDVE